MLARFATLGLHHCSPSCPINSTAVPSRESLAQSLTRQRSSRVADTSLLLRQTTQNQGGQRHLSPPPGGRGVWQAWSHRHARVLCCHSSGTGCVTGQSVKEAAVQSPPVGRTSGHGQCEPLSCGCHTACCWSACPLVPEPPNAAP